MLHETIDEELPVETTEVLPSAAPPGRPHHQSDPLYDYRREHLTLQERLAEIWGPEAPYTPVPEETSSWFKRYYYGWVYETVVLASNEKLKHEALPPPTRDVRAHDCGLRLSRAVQAAMYERNAWNCMVGTEVVSTLDASSRGVLRWVGVPQQGGYTRMMAGVEWSVPPALRTAARSDDSGASPFFDGVAHGEHLFTPEQSGMSTLEETTTLMLNLTSRGGVVEIPTPKRLPLARLLAFKLPYYLWMQVPFLLVSNICVIALPSILQAFVAFLDDDPGMQTWGRGLGLVAGIFLVQAMQSVCNQRFNYISFRCGLRYRSALNSLIFEKCMIISSKSLAQPDMNAGRIINMVSTDVERVYFFMLFCMLLWSSPIVLLLAIVQLWRLVGWCAIMAVASFLATIPLNAFFMGIQMRARQDIAKAADARVKATSEFFSGIRVAKFMTWEPCFVANIESKRAVELFFLKKIQNARVATSFVNNAAPMLMIAFVFTVYYCTGHELSSTVVFPTIALLGVLRQPFQQIPWVFTMAVQFLISIGRIRRFLECDNATCSTVQDMEEYWREQREHSTACQLAAVLENVDVTAFVPVKLPFAPKVKTSLLSRALRMLCCGQCKPTKRHPPPSVVVENTGYVSPSSASRHIVEGCRGPVHTATPTSIRSPKTPQMKADDFFELEPKVLLHDVSVSVPRGKLTVVLGATGSGKSTLLQSLLSQFEISEGRVWAERSIAYVPQQAWIMNATVRGNILFFDEEDAARLADAVRVSQLEADVAQLGGGLETEIGEKGVNLSGGQKARVSLARAVYANRDVYLLDDPLSALDAHVGERVVEECFLGALAGKTRVLATHQVHIVPRADYVVALGDGRVEFSGSSADFMRTSIYAGMASGVTENKEEGDAERSESALDAEEEAEVTLNRSASKGEGAEEEGDAAAKDPAAGSFVVEEEKASGGVPWRTYMAYFRYCGGAHVAATIVLVFAVTELITVSSSVWLSRWTTKGEGEGNTVYLTVYLLMVLVGGAGYPFRFIVSYTAMRHGGGAMHRTILRSVTAGTIAFFDRTPLGRLLNRFSRDIDTLDNGLQMSTISLLECLFSISVSMLVTIYSQPFVLIALAPCGYLYYRLMMFYNSANREIRRQTSVKKTPVFTLLTELTSGLATIMAYGKAKEVMTEALERLDVVHSCGNLENNTNRWLAVRVEFLSNIVVTAIAFVGVVTTCLRSSRIDIGLISLSLTMAMRTTGELNWLVRMVATMEADMNSVERLQYYIDHIPKEAMPELDAEVDALERRTGMAADVTGTVVIEPASPTSAAPHTVQAGSLVFEGVQMRYREGLPLVLRGVSFRIAPREKVGIVGRTGSGKSTLLLTFMRIVEVCGGEIRVNGREIGAYGLRELRRQFSMIPQDPVLFDGTVRQNVDPFLEASSAEVWAALELVGLRERVASESEGIDSRVLEGGSNYSVGQRQLMCMARALLKKGSGFILMDEATANIDPALDRQIQATVMSAFSAYTVITIAHRLHTVAQYDKIIVMDHGAVAEMGSPRELVMNRQSIFHSMVEAGGPLARRHFRSLVGRRDNEVAPYSKCG
ncbi:ABCC1 / ATP-binding cassette (ABC) protein [Leishmania donovani]|uniref:Pentamidine_resistance_protein_1/GeneDB:LmjF.31.1 430 n=1 Tax=Leishmania donovani TaxID=5661 RepID=A0A6J8FF17_LEIDO|nr:ABCC1 / ATP-binding cassette (ABC) protein [Leishmania donovani]VDZ44771.1 pentamidine_resistance_protein_1/GeneDB:LmjF.31.1430 [Leishmania donovani]